VGRGRGGGADRGIGFTVSHARRDARVTGAQLEEAKLGILSAALVPRSSPGWCSAATERVPRSLYVSVPCSGAPRAIEDLYRDVDQNRDHFRGPREAPVPLRGVRRLRVSLLAGRTSPVGRELLRDFADIRMVGNIPLNDVHINAHSRRRRRGRPRIRGGYWEAARPELRSPGRLVLMTSSSMRRAGIDEKRQ